MTPPRRPPTMADVARRANVSPMTVSRALRADTSVSAATRRAILEAAEAVGYVVDAAAASLRSRRTGFVAVTIPSLNNANFAETVRGLQEGLAARDLQILLGTTGYDTGEEERLVGQLLRRRPEAIVVTGGRHTPLARRLLAMADVPVVETWDLPPDPIGHVVGFSNAAAAGAIVDHLAAAGYRRIAFLGGDQERDGRGADRRAGFVAAMERRGLDAGRLVPAGPPPISMREGAAAMADLLARLPDTEAVACVSDLSAFGALAECRRRGVDVPGDVAVAGFGNYEIAGVSVPTLTTVDPFPRAIGAAAAALILDVLDGVRTGPARIEVTPRLVRGASSR